MEPVTNLENYPSEESMVKAEEKEEIVILDTTRTFSSRAELMNFVRNLEQRVSLPQIASNSFRVSIRITSTSDTSSTTT